MSVSNAAVVALALIFLAHCSQAGKTDLDASQQAREESLERTWSEQLPEVPVEADTKVAYKSPIKRVVNLLEEMRAQLTKEADNEAEMYDKMVCWCETNEKEKEAAIAAADAKDVELMSEIEGLSAKGAELATNIEYLKEQIAADEAAVKQATAIREKEAAAFNTEEKELVQAITNLKNAINILSKHNALFLQTDSPLLASLRSVLHDVALKYELMLGDIDESKKYRKSHGASFLGLDNKQGQNAGRQLMAALGMNGDYQSVLPVEFAEQRLQQFAQDKPSAGSFVQQPNANSGSYSAQSGTIYGILTQMLEEMEADLSTSQKDELKAAEDYKALMEAKNAQIEAGKKKLDEMETDAAGTTKALSDAKEDLELTRNQRSADVEFLRNLKVTCQKLDAEWEARSKTRTEEITAVSEAISIITKDDNMDILRNTVTLLQVQSSADSDSAMAMRRSHAAAALRQAAMQPVFDDLLSSWRNRDRLPTVGAAAGPRSQLSTLAVSVQLDAFTKVKELMDNMVADLKKQQEEEVAAKALCVKELDDNEKTTYIKTEEKEDLEVKLEGLAKAISTLEEEIEAAKKQIADTKTEIAKASEDREKENAEYQTTIADQRATQAILKKALDRLKAFYKKAALLQKNQQTPPVQFTKYKKNAGSGPVMGLIEQIIEDSKKVEDEAIKGEADAQAAYETIVKDSNALIAELSTAVTDKTKAIAAAKQETAEAEADLTSTNGELESLAEYLADLHAQCDFLMKNFDIRQKARLQEIEAIQKAKAILSGSMASAS